MRAMAVAVGFLVLAAPVAQAAPKQLLNKSILITWSESIQEKTPEGRVITTPLSRDRIAYVSSAGRIFVRSTQTVQRAQKSAELAPGAGAGTLAFQGNIMVGSAAFNGFARRVIVTFDASFTSCTVNVLYGKSGGPRTWKSVDGTQTLEVLSISVGSTSCSIRDGNAFAS